MLNPQVTSKLWTPQLGRYLDGGPLPVGEFLMIIGCQGYRKWGADAQKLVSVCPVSFASEIESPQQLIQELAKADYLAELGLATALFCAVRLPQPLLLEGEAGVGKTQAAKALAQLLDTPLIRLQCFEGIDASEALYE